MPNPVISILDLQNSKGTSAGYISCVTNAGFTQMATVTVTDANNTTVASGTFQGKGEGNVPTPLTSGGTLLSFQGAQLPLTVTATFNYDPNGTFVPNDANKVIPTTEYDTSLAEFILIKSEDSIDNDYNDLIMSIMVIKH